MKILTPGNPQPDPLTLLYYGKCSKCQAKVEATERDIKTKAGTDTVVCPTQYCNSDIFVYTKTKIEENQALRQCFKDFIFP